MNRKTIHWIFVVSTGTLVAWSLLFSLVFIENQSLSEKFSKLEQSKNLSFGYVQELTKRPIKGTFAYLVTYSFNSSSGKQFVSNELIDYDLYKKMRLGDSIQIFQLETKLFGKSSSLSKIKGNSEPPPHLENLYFLCQTGELLLLTCWVASVFAMVLGRLYRKYP